MDKTHPGAGPSKDEAFGRGRESEGGARQARARPDRGHQAGVGSVSDVQSGSLGAVKMRFSDSREAIPGLAGSAEKPHLSQASGG